MGATKRLLLAYCVLGTLLTLGAKPVFGQRECCDGDWWFKLKPQARQAYVFGYAVGYQHGHIDGCHEGAKGWPGREKLEYENDPGKKCLDQQLDFSKGTEYFAHAITNFYKRYPEDRSISIYEVLQQLGRGVSLEEVHAYPFMRPSRSNP